MSIDLGVGFLTICKASRQSNLSILLGVPTIRIRVFLGSILGAPWLWLMAYGNYHLRF